MQIGGRDFDGDYSSSSIRGVVPLGSATAKGTLIQATSGGLVDLTFADGSTFPGASVDPGLTFLPFTLTAVVQSTTSPATIALVRGTI